MRWLLVALAVALFAGPPEPGRRPPPSVTVPTAPNWCRSPPAISPWASPAARKTPRTSPTNSAPGPTRRTPYPHFAAPFYLGRTDVTRGQFSAFVNATGYDPAPCKSGRSWRSPGFAQTDDHPVVCVGADDALAYVRWLSSRTGKAYRLPSEAEWEYAARAGTSTPRYWGTGTASVCAHAAAGGCALTGTTAVAHYAPNAFGLHDMLGDAWQWTADCWHDSYQGAPADGSAWLRDDCVLRVVRGGAWSAGTWALRAGGRDANRTNYRESDVGFRVARAATP